MIKIVTAIFDGQVLRPEEPIPLAPNTRVQVTIETAEPAGAALSFLRTAQSLNLAGPPDWSARLDDYLYGERSDAAG